MSLLEEALLLQRAAHDLMYLGMDGSPIYSDDLSRRNSEVYRLATTLYNSGTWGTTVEEQANVCLALLKGYSASFIDHGEKQQHVHRQRGPAPAHRRKKHRHPQRGALAESWNRQPEALPCAPSSGLTPTKSGELQMSIQYPLTPREGSTPPLVMWLTLSNAQIQRLLQGMDHTQETGLVLTSPDSCFVLEKTDNASFLNPEL